MCGGGRAGREQEPVETVGGCTLMVSLDGGTVVLTDENGPEARVIQTDVEQANGMVHVIHRVLPQGQAAM